MLVPALAAAQVAFTGGCPTKSQSLGDDPGDGSGGSEAGESGGSGGSGAGTEGGSEESGGAQLPFPQSVWTRFENDVMGLRLAIAPDGSIYVAGYRGYTFEGGDSGTFAAIWIGKFTPAGDPSWTVEIPQAEDLDAPNDIAATSDSGFVLVIEDFTVENGGENGITRYDATGAPMWTAAFDGRPHTVAVGPDDAIVVAGLQTANPNNYFALAMAFAGDGTPAWSKTYGDPNARSLISGVAIAPGGDVLLSGRMGVEPASTRAQAWVHRAAADGTALWDHLLSDAIATDDVYVVDVTSQGVAVALGWADEAWVKAFDVDGTELWSTAPLVDRGRNLAADAEAGFVVSDGEILMDEGEECGFDGEASTCPSQLRVVRTDAGGVERWLAIDPTCASGQDIAVTADDRVLVLASCPDAVPAEVGMGLLLYADP